MKILLLLVILALIAIYVAVLVWAYGDAETRGKPGWLVVLMMVFLTLPGGLLVWLLVRPEETARYSKPTG